MTTDWLDDMPYDPPARKRKIEPPNPLDSLTGLAAYLLRPKVLEFIRQSDLALSFHDEMKATIERVWLVIDSQGEAKVQMRNAVCLEPDCAGAIVATVPPLHYGDPTIRCTTCEHVWTGVEWRQAGGYIERGDVVRPVWISIREAADSLGVTDRHVRSLVAAGRLGCHQFSPRRRLVRQDHVIQLRDRRQAGTPSE